MRPCLVRSVVPLVLVLLAACEPGESPPIPLRVHSISLTTPGTRLIAPYRMPLPGIFAVHVDADAGVSADVRWTSSDPAVLSIDSARVAHFCAPASAVTLTATSLADTTKSASVTLQVGSSLVAFASVTSLTDAATDAPVDVGAVRGEVLVGTAVDPERLACLGLARVALAAVDSAGVEHAIASRDFAPPVRAFADRFRWNTAGLRDGQYRLEFRAWLAGATSFVEVDERPVIVRH